MYFANHTWAWGTNFIKMQQVPLQHIKSYFLSKNILLSKQESLSLHFPTSWQTVHRPITTIVTHLKAYCTMTVIMNKDIGTPLGILSQYCHNCTQHN